MHTSIVPNSHKPNHSAVALATPAPDLLAPKGADLIQLRKHGSENQPPSRLATFQVSEKTLQTASKKFYYQEVACTLLAGELFNRKPDKDGVMVGTEHRIHKCQCFPISRGNLIGVRRRHIDKKTYFTGLQTCGSVWVCPRCSAKIAAVRRGEVGQAILAHTTQGGEVLLLTITIPHSRHNTLEELLDLHAALYRAMWKGTKAKKIRDDYLGCVGDIKAIEATHSKSNGWHPHSHTVLFVRAGLDPKEVEEMLWGRWKEVFGHYMATHPLAEQLRPSRDAFDVQDGSRAASYILKWGLESEITANDAKMGKVKGSRTPMQLLVDYQNKGDKQAGALFRKWGQATFRRVRLKWSNGLRALLLTTLELTDDQIARSVRAEDELLGRLTPETWNLILKNCLRDETAAAASRESMEGVQALLEPYLRPDQQMYLDDDNTLIIMLRPEPRLSLTLEEQPAPVEPSESSALELQPAPVEPVPILLATYESTSSSTAAQLFMSDTLRAEFWDEPFPSKKVVLYGDGHFICCATCTEMEHLHFFACNAVDNFPSIKRFVVLQV